MKKTLTRGNAAGLLLSAMLIISGCSGGGGGGGSSAGGNTVSAENSVVTAVRNSAPVSACPQGGIQVDAGIDDNGNGVLDPAEVDSTQYVCNGANGSSGLTVLVSMTNEPAGTNCATGGKKISAGNDVNANNVLDAGEITSTDYICNGPAGPGVTWVEVTGTSVQAASNTGYLANNLSSQVTITLPPSPAVGGIVQVSGIGAGGWKIAQNAGQSIITQNIPGSIGAVWTARESNRFWHSIASSSDGTRLAAVDFGGQIGGQIYTSTDSGVTWTARESNRNWSSIASSSDGTKLVAAASGGQIYTSTDSGASWTARESARYWYSIASSSDGTRLAAVVYGGQIYTSTDSGASWIARESNRWWYSIASSSDGTRLAAVDGSQIYTSTDSGITWTSRESNRGWYSIASSSDGIRLAAVVGGGQIYTSEQRTTIGTTGSISGDQYDAISLQCVGNNIFTILSHEGNLMVQ